MSPHGRKVLEESTTWFGDGTFDKCPNGFSQLYIIGGNIKSLDGKAGAYILINQSMLF